jgi:choice-of-anchor C domain-containing protein
VKKLGLGSVFAIVLSVALAGTALGAAFDNGNLDSGAYVDNGSGFMADVTGSTISGWNIGGHVDWIGNYWQSYSGAHSVDMNATPRDDSAFQSAGVLTQALDTVKYGTYVMTFYMSGNPNCGQSTMDLWVEASPVVPYKLFQYTIPADASNDNMAWVQQTVTFVAAGATTTLSLLSGEEGACGPVVDNVVIIETLPTGALCKDGGWQHMTDSLNNPFKNQGDCVSFYATGEKNLAF